MRTALRHFPAIFGAVAFGSAALGLWAPLEFPFTVTTYGQIHPTRSWALEKGTSGQLLATLFDAKTGKNEEYRVSDFGQSNVYFTLHERVTPGGVVAQGDTIGTIVSSEIQERLIALNGQLLAARTLLTANATGEKAAIIREAEQRLEHAKQKRVEYEKVQERTLKLFQANLVSEAECDIVRGQAKLLDTEISIAESQLAVAQTGVKPEALKLVHAQIAALESEIAIVEARAASCTLIAPISGRVSRASGSTVLVVISDTSDYVVSMPVKWGDHFHVAGSRTVELRPSGGSMTAHGRVVALDQEVVVLNGQQVVMVTAVIDEPAEGFVPGVLAHCRIECPPLSAWGHVRRFFSS